MRHSYIYTALAAFLSLTLAGCGGGGGGDQPSTPTPASYAVTATVTGLQGTLGLATDVGGSVSTSSNGSVTLLAQAPGGSAPQVNIVSQPPGQRCAVEGTAIATASKPVVAVRCDTLLTASRSALSSGESVPLTGGPAYSGSPRELNGKLAGGETATVLQSPEAFTFLVPGAAVGRQTLQLRIDSRDYAFDFDLQARPATAALPTATVSNAINQAQTTLDALVAADPSFQAAQDSLRTRMAQAQAQLAAMPSADQVAAANFLDSLLSTTAGAQRAPAHAPAHALASDSACDLGQRLFVTRVVALASLSYVYALPPTWLTAATVVVQGVLLADIARFIDTFLDEECFEIRKLQAAIDGIQVNTARARPLALPRAQALATDTRLLFDHGVPVTLRATADAALPAEVAGSVPPIQRVLSAFGSWLPSSMTSLLAQWTPEFQRTARLNRYAVASVSRGGVAAVATPIDSSQALATTLSYAPGAEPTEAQDMTLTLQDPRGRLFDVPVRLSPVGYEIRFTSVTQRTVTLSHNGDSWQMALVTISGTAKGVRDGLVLHVGMNPSTGASPLWPPTASCGSWTGRVVTSNIWPQCVRQAGDPTTTTFTYTQYMSLETLAVHPVSLGWMQPADGTPPLQPDPGFFSGPGL